MADSSSHEPLGPWGNLKGVRPGKIIHQLSAQGLNEEEIILHLQNVHKVTWTKIQLLLKVREEEEKIFDFTKSWEKTWGVYIGIPFCPSRCYYCSFFSHSSAAFKPYIQLFFQALLEEMSLTLKRFPFLKERVDCLYIGGGTPATLGPKLSSELLDFITKEFSSLKEITFEGGRPELMDTGLLRELKGKIHRLCINPQSMSDEVLKINGRGHNREDTVKAYETARTLGFNDINMDVIAGLPGDDFFGFKRSLREIVSLRPENITVHALALKRASLLKQNPSLLESLKDEEAKLMTDWASEFLAHEGYFPYYCYRQRDILAGAENIGYTLPGYSSRYNMMMIAERMNILGFGGGAASKFLFPWLKARERIQRVDNPKDVFVYLERGPKEIAERKFQALEALYLRGEENVD